MCPSAYLYMSCVEIMSLFVPFENSSLLNKVSILDNPEALLCICLIQFELIFFDNLEESTWGLATASYPGINTTLSLEMSVLLQPRIGFPYLKLHHIDALQ